MKKNRKNRQDIKIYGFQFPQGLLLELKQYQEEKNIRIPASAYAALLCILKQVHQEKSSSGTVQELRLANFSKEIEVKYSTLYIGMQFLFEHGIVSKSINPATKKEVLHLNSFGRFHGLKKEGHNYFNVPHSLFKTNIISECVRTSNPGVLELLFSLLNQFRNGIIRIKNQKSVETITYTRTMAFLKNALKKRAQAVRTAISLLEPLLNIKLVNIVERGKQLWVQKVEFSLKPETVVENTDAFEIHPLTKMLGTDLELLLNSLQMAYKPKDLFDVMISYRDEVIKLLQYVSKRGREGVDYSERDSLIESFFHRCLDSFENQYNEIVKKKGRFIFSSSIGAYFRIIFRNGISRYIKTHLSTETLHFAKINEFEKTGVIPRLYNI